jgi:hypothetical protein
MPTFSFTPATLARMQEQTRRRERQRIATELVAMAEELHAQYPERSAVLIEAANEVRLTVAPTAAIVSGGGAVNGAPARDDVGQREPSDELPAVHHHDDFEEGIGLVRTYGARMRSHGITD